MIALEAQAIRILDDWYESLDLYQNKLPPKGSIQAALVVLNRLRENYDLSISAHVSEKEAQIAGLSGASVKKILAEFGETRILSTIGGRSNRGARGDVARLLEAMESLKLAEQPTELRSRVLCAMQRHLVTEHIPKFFSAKRVKASFDRAAATWMFIHALLGNAKQNGKGGAVAEHLVGAKLALKFPHVEIRNKPTSSADFQHGYAGDFEIGTTAFHVTLAPLPELFEKVKSNLANGLRVYVLVDSQQLAGAKQQADLQTDGRTAVESIESFIATNIDELSGFDGDRVVNGLNMLLTKYNERVDEVEVDKSLLVEIPPNLE